MTDSSQPTVAATRVKQSSPKKTAPVWALPQPSSLTLQNHLLVHRHYRVATAAIELFVDLVERCIRVLVPGALIHSRPRMGKTHAIDYVALQLARHHPDILVLRMYYSLVPVLLHFTGWCQMKVQK